MPKHKSKPTYRLLFINNEGDYFLGSKEYDYRCCEEMQDEMNSAIRLQYPHVFSIVYRDKSHVDVRNFITWAFDIKRLGHLDMKSIGTALKYIRDNQHILRSHSTVYKKLPLRQVS